MRFLGLQLENYIGIYNGLGMTNIYIDLSKATHRILLIRGENGSGKTTIFKALSVLPDSNDCFIPGVAAHKSVSLQDGYSTYLIRCEHHVNGAGDRLPTRVYIQKTAPGLGTIELNPNGNVSSYMDVIENELGLDPNFVALSQLSSEDKGIAGKRPAERKRFVNAIMTSMEVYNGIYKSLSKKAAGLKQNISTVSISLSAIGDPQSLLASLKATDAQIDAYNRQREESMAAIVESKTKKEMIDHDGQTERLYQQHAAALEIEEAKIHEINATLSTPCFDAEYNAEIYKKNIESYKRAFQDADKQDEQLMSEYAHLQHKKNDDEVLLAQKENQIATLTNNDTFENLSDRIADHEARMKELAEQIAETGIPAGVMSKDQYIKALDTLKEIQEAVSAFKSKYYQALIDAVLEVVQHEGKVIMQDVDVYKERMAKEQAFIDSLNAMIVEYNHRMERLSVLDNRPTICQIDSCFFVQDLLALQAEDPAGKRAQAVHDLNYHEVMLEQAKKQWAYAVAFNECGKDYKIIARMIDMNGAILYHFPNGAIFSDKASFIDALIGNQDIKYVDDIYAHISVANAFDEYLMEKQTVDSLQQKLALYEGNASVVSEMQTELDYLETSLKGTTARLKKIEEERKEAQETSVKMRQNHEESIRLAAVYGSLAKHVAAAREHKAHMSNYMGVMQKVTECNTIIQHHQKILDDLSGYLRPLTRERDRLTHAIQQIDDYNSQLINLQRDYALIERIKYHSNPTTGIQLVFMELYMGKIIGLANSLLSLLFGGKYVIQPFIIDEANFRIPCLGDGLINDDISSMSSAQVAMISMIIGFSLLHNSSSHYNIIKLDELDGPLDEANRLLFIEVLKKIMDIMRTEQCVLISHNTEVDVDDCDVILLRHENLSGEYDRGNIIWRY